MKHGITGISGGKNDEPLFLCLWVLSELFKPDQRGSCRLLPWGGIYQNRGSMPEIPTPGKVQER